MYSIVIPSYGTKGIMMLDNLLSSISSFNNPSLNEIIISDDGSTDITTQYLTGLQDKYRGLFNIKLIFNPYYHSFSKTVNSGMKSSKDDILLLNNDMIALTSFEPLATFALSNTKYGIIGAKLLFKNLHIQHAGIIRMRLISIFRHVHKYKNHNHPPANVPKKYIAVTGACQYIKRDLINKIGYYDEQYMLSYEDVDYCLTALLNGYEVWYIPSVVLIHYEKGTRSGLFDWGKNRDLFWKKWNALYEKIKTRHEIPDDDMDIIVAQSSIASGLYMMIR